VLRDSNRCASGCGNLPDLIVASSRGSEVHPLTVARPTGHDAFDERVRGAAIEADDDNFFA
jgi:hypothetical protein